jgi:predicted flavoprotein YhiN
MFLLAQAGINPDLRWTDLPARLLNRLVLMLGAYEMQVQGKTTFKEEFVTAGGIATKEVDVQSMQSKISKGLFFAGELLDVDGITGGFNFQHAWTSGYIAAKSIAAAADAMAEV